MSLHSKIMEYLDEHKADMKDEVYRTIADILMKDEGRDKPVRAEEKEEKEERRRVQLHVCYYCNHPDNAQYHRSMKIPLYVTPRDLEYLKAHKHTLITPSSIGTYTILDTIMETLRGAHGVQDEDEDERASILLIRQVELISGRLP